MIYCKLSILILLLFSLWKTDITSLSVKDEIPSEITSGETLILRFADAKKSSRLLLKNAYGSTIIAPTGKDKLVFEIPEFVSKKSGVLAWNLLTAKKKKSGTVKITAEPEPASIENYFGPRSIQAGINDYSMLVSIPTDAQDNPLSDGTKVAISEYFQGRLKRDSVKMQHMFAWKNIYTKTKAGTISVSSSSQGLKAREMISQVYPSTATDFSISAKREHEYADGNQVVDLITSKIMDAYGNVVSDGTSVEFIIENAEGMKLISSATTISGVAIAKILHPEQPENWLLSANVTGMAASDTLALKFKSVLKDFQTVINKDENTIQVGPLESYMGQLIPDGASVRLQILDKNAVVKQEMQESSKDGFATFLLPADKKYWKSNIFKIEAMGLSKSVYAGKNK